jgi:outer membrane biosynthesis protein TonB
MRRWLVLVSAAFHLAIVFGLFIAGFWRLELLDRPRISVAIAAPLPPPPAPSGGAAPTKVPTFTHKHIAPDPVQPEPRPVEAEKPIATTTGGGGAGSGSGSGKGSGDPEAPGECTENCGSGSAQQVAQVVVHHDDVIVPPAVIRGLRISGETQIHPADLDKTAMNRDGKDRVTAMFKTCVTAAGDVGSVTMLKSSGYPDYDGALAAGLHGWRYKPYEIGGQAVKACGIVTFVYQIK